MDYDFSFQKQQSMHQTAAISVGEGFCSVQMCISHVCARMHTYVCMYTCLRGHDVKCDFHPDFLLQVSVNYVGRALLCLLESHRFSLTGFLSLTPLNTLAGFSGLLKVFSLHSQVRS